MRRYYSHYTFIHPDIYLKNYIVEMGDDNRIIRVFPFEKEVEKTEFYSGLLLYIPQDMDLSNYLKLITFSNLFSSDKAFTLDSTICYKIIHREDLD